LILTIKWHKNLSETVLIDRFSSKTALLRESTKNEFVSMNYQRVKDIFMLKREKIPRVVAGLDRIYSLRRLTE